MTLILIGNAVLAAFALLVVLGMAVWGVRGSHHEGRPVDHATGRRWVRPTISLRHGAPAVAPRVRPFTS
jgi:hypothetical protein